MCLLPGGDALYQYTVSKIDLCVAIETPALEHCDFLEEALKQTGHHNGYRCIHKIFLSYAKEHGLSQGDNGVHFL